MAIFNLEYYRAFYYAAKSGSYSNASRILCITQPAVSQAVKKLETQLGVSLFRRDSHGMVLTQEGEQLLPHVESALSSLEAGEQRINRLRTLSNGELSIGATESGLIHQLLPRFPIFCQQYPNIKIHFKGSTTAELINMLHDGTIDLMLGVTPIPREENFSITFLQEMQDVFFANEHFDNLRNQVIDPVELMKYPVVAASTGSSFAANLSAWAYQEGFIFAPQISVLTTAFVLPFVESGIAIGCAPNLFVDRWTSNSNLFRIQLSRNPPTRKIFLATNPKLPLSAASREFIKILIHE